MRIVLVEDNQMLAEGIQKVLLDEGHSVDYFVDGGLADQHLKHEGADIAIIDINLPTLDGVSITKNIRTRKQLFQLLFLLLEEQQKIESSDLMQVQMII